MMFPLVNLGSHNAPAYIESPPILSSLEYSAVLRWENALARLFSLGYHIDRVVVPTRLLSEGIRLRLSFGYESIRNGRCSFGELVSLVRSMANRNETPTARFGFFAKQATMRFDSKGDSYCESVTRFMSIFQSLVRVVDVQPKKRLLELFQRGILKELYPSFRSALLIREDDEDSGPDLLIRNARPATSSSAASAPPASVSVDSVPAVVPSSAVLDPPPPPRLAETPAPLPAADPRDAGADEGLPEATLPHSVRRALQLRYEVLFEVAEELDRSIRIVQATTRGRDGMVDDDHGHDGDSGRAWHKQRQAPAASAPAAAAPANHAVSTMGVTRDTRDTRGGGMASVQCHYCHEKGHMVRSCPKLQAKNAAQQSGNRTHHYDLRDRRAQPVAAVQSEATPASGDDAQSTEGAPLSAVSCVPLVGSDVLRGASPDPVDNLTDSVGGCSGSKEGAQDVCAPVRAVRQVPSSHPVACVTVTPVNVVMEPPLSFYADTDGRMRVVPEVSEGARGAVVCLVDPGSTHSYSSKKYLDSMGVPSTAWRDVTRDDHPGMASLAVASVKRPITQFCVLRLRLSSDAPFADVKVFVLDDRDPHDHIILGTRDVHHYSFCFGPTQSIAWQGGRVEEEPSREAWTSSEVAEMTAKELATNPLMTTPDGKPLPCVIHRSVFSDEQYRKVVEATLAKAHIFGGLDKRPAVMDPYRIHLKEGALPVRCAPRRLPPDKRAAVDKYLKEMLELGVIRESRSEWSSPVTVAPKGAGWRVCVDYRELNAVTLPDPFPLPLIMELQTMFAGCRFMAKFDLSSGYHQCPVDPATVPMLSFVVHEVGQFEYVRMPFGLRNAAAHFQRQMQEWIALLRRRAVYQDDVQIMGEQFDWFFTDLVDFYDVVEKRHGKLKGVKCEIGPPELCVLGMLITATSISIDPERKAALKSMSLPHSKETLQSFLGLMNYFSALIPRYSDRVAPLFALLRKGATWDFTPEHVRHCAELRDIVVGELVLHHPDPDRPLVLRADASRTGVGGIIYFERPSAADPSKMDVFPVTFFSRRLSPAESKFCVLELEALAVMVGLDKARPFIRDGLVILTDHSNLTFMSKSVNTRVQRWSLKLNEFDCVVLYREGRTNWVADALSRLPPPLPAEHPTVGSIADCLARLPAVEGSGMGVCDAEAHIAPVGVGDAPGPAPAPDGAPAPPAAAPPPTHVDDLRVEVSDAPLDTFLTVGDIALMVKGMPHNVVDGRIVLDARPADNLVSAILTLAHDHPTCAHFGPARTEHRLMHAVSWATLHQDVCEYCARCPVCQLIKTRHDAAPDMASTAYADVPWDRVFMDVVGPNTLVDGHEYCLDDD